MSFIYRTNIEATIPYITPKNAINGEYYIKGTFESSGCYSISGSIKVIINKITTDIEAEISDNSSIYSYNDEIHIVKFGINITITIFDIIGKQEYTQA